MYSVSKKTHAMESAAGRLRLRVGQRPRGWLRGWCCRRSTGRLSKCWRGQDPEPVDAVEIAGTARLAVGV